MSTSHLSPALLSALADGELSAAQLAGANDHLAACPACTTSALAESLLKSASARAGQRYTPPPDLRERLARLAPQESASPVPTKPFLTPRPERRLLGWAAACALLLISASIVLIQRTAQRTAIVSSQTAALVTEVLDQHIATLAANAPPQVVSSDRHTVKPWFQGKLPFSFNLPQDLPADTSLDGANHSYLRNQPVAQLLYSIGKHRVSVFLQQRTGATTVLSAEHSGFHVAGFTTPSLEVLAVSDVDPTRLTDLAARLEHAQTATPAQPK